MTDVLKAKGNMKDGRVCEQRNAWVCVFALMRGRFPHTDHVCMYECIHAYRNVQMLCG